MNDRLIRYLIIMGIFIFVVAIGCFVASSWITISVKDCKARNGVLVRTYNGRVCASKQMIIEMEPKP